MFRRACKDLLSTVLPAVIAWRLRRGKVDCGVGAGMFVNPDGWFITAGHILSRIPTLDNQVKINNSPKRKGRRGNEVTEYAFLLGHNSGMGIKAQVNASIDLGIARLEGVKPPPNYVFPKFRVRDVEQGELLCRAGFPFVEDRRPKWSASKKKFEFDQFFPLPMFVNEALVSRFANVEVGGRNVGTWIETSSPGLRGQSGGPLVDIDGYICGIQVNTEHYPLGFRGKARNQFLHVGRAIHSKTVRDELDKRNIDYYLEGS